jgi:hypothetical protein
MKRKADRSESNPGLDRDAGEAQHAEWARLDPGRSACWRSRYAAFSAPAGSRPCGTLWPWSPRRSALWTKCQTRWAGTARQRRLE